MRQQRATAAHCTRTKTVSAAAPRVTRWLLVSSLLASGLANAQPLNVSVSPSSGTGASQTFAFTSSSPNGYSYIWGMYMLFNYSVEGGGANGGSCELLYNPGSNVIQLIADNGQSWAASGHLGASGSLQNSQCSLNLASSSSSGTGNNLTVRVALTFLAGLPGPQNIYLDTVDNGGAYDYFQQMGTWTTSTVSSQAPAVVSVSPSSGTGTSGTFSFVTSSVNGYSYVMEVYALVETPGNWGNSCYVQYLRGAGQLLIADANGAWHTLNIGSPGTVSSNQCTLNAGASSATGSGNNLTLNLALTFNSSWTGAKNTFLSAYDRGDHTAPWTQLGTWTVSGPPPTTTWSFNSSAFSLPSSPVEYVGTGAYAYFSWIGTINLATVVPTGAIITGSTINASGLSGSTSWDSRWGNPPQGTCGVYTTGTDNYSQVWVTGLTYWPGSSTAGCILSISGQSSLSGTVTFYMPTISSPTPPSGPSSGTIGTSYTYSTGGAVASTGDTPQYYFDWGDGTNSGWLAPGVTSASHSWTSAGTFQVKAEAEDAAHGITSSSTSTQVVIIPLPPTLTSISPAGFLQGTAVSVTLTGTNFVSGTTTVSPSISGVTVSGVTVSNPNTLTATFTMASNAAIGAATVKVSTSGGTSSNLGFNVYAPVVTSILTFPVGLSISVDGTATQCSPSCNYTWVPGTGHTIAASTQSGGSGTQWVWSGWSDGGAASHGITASTSGGNYTASFNPQYYFTAQVSPTGTGSLSPGSGWYTAGASFWATPAPNVGYQLSSFSPGGAVPSYDVVMNGPLTVTANFIPFTGQTVTSNPPGAAFTIDGSACSAPCTFNWTLGSQHTVSTTSPQSVGSGTQLMFSSWWDGSTGSSGTITAAVGTSYTANFSAQYYLTTAVSPTGGGTISPLSGWQNAGTQITLAASANSGYQFTNFTGTISGGSGLSVTMNGPTSETANFAPAGGFTLTATSPDQTVAASGAGQYTVTSTPSSGFSGQIALSASCDSDAVPTFSPSTIPANGSSTLMLTTSSSDSFDLTSCTISGTSGSNTGRFPIILRLFVPVTITTSPSGVGLTATADGGSPSGTIRALWRVGSAHTISVAALQTGTDGNQYAFLSWSDSGAATHTVTASHAVMRYTATLSQPYTISGQVALDGAGLQGATVSLNPRSGGQGISTTTDVNGNYSLAGAATGSYLVTPSFMSYTFTQPISICSLSASLTGVNFSVTGGSGVTAGPGGLPQPPASPPATISPPSPVTATYQGCTDMTGVWDDPNEVDFAGYDGTWLLAQQSDGSVTGYMIASVCAPFTGLFPRPGVNDVTGSITSSGTASLTATPEVSMFYCDGVNVASPTITLQATVSCSSAPVSSEDEAGTQPPPTGVYTQPQAQQAPRPLTRKSFVPGIMMTQDIANTDPDKQVSVSISDPTPITTGSLRVSRTGNLAVTASVAPFWPSQGPPSSQPLQLYQQDNVGATPQNQPITFSYALSSLGAPVSYSNVTATWNGLHVSGSQNFSTMGAYTLTQYNSISEQTCNAAPATAYVFAGDGTCNYSVVADQNGLKGNFITQVTLNGTGISVNPNVGLIAAFRATELFSYGLCDFPRGSNQDPLTGNVFVKIAAVEGSCGNALASGSLATNPNPAAVPVGTGTWNCRDQVALLSNTGNPDVLGTYLPVQDWCPACTAASPPLYTDFHADVFSTTQACQKVGNYSATPIQGVRLR